MEPFFGGGPGPARGRCNFLEGPVNTTTTNVGLNENNVEMKGTFAARLPPFADSCSVSFRYFHCCDSEYYYSERHL